MGGAVSAPAVRNIIVERVQNALRMVTDPETGADATDRLILALVLGAGAIAVAWPQQKAAPRLIVRAATLAGAIWARRAMWLPAASPAAR